MLRKLGERYQRKFNGIEYLCEKTEKGIVKIKRLTPYVDKSKTNKKSNVGGNNSVTGTQRPAKKNREDRRDVAIHKLRGSEKIYIAENNRLVSHVVRIDSRTEVIKHKK